MSVVNQYKPLGNKSIICNSGHEMFNALFSRESHVTVAEEPANSTGQEYVSDFWGELTT